MEPITIEKAIENAKRIGLKPGKVSGTDTVQFTKGNNTRLQEISWDEFRSHLQKRNLAVFESKGFMKIMKK